MAARVALATAGPKPLAFSRPSVVSATVAPHAVRRALVPIAVLLTRLISGVAQWGPRCTPASSQPALPAGVARRVTPP